MNLSARVLTGEESAKELRLFGLQELWLKRWQDQFLQFFSEMQQIRKKGAIVLLLWSVFSRIGVALPFVYVVMGVLGGRYTFRRFGAIFGFDCSGGAKFAITYRQLC